MTEVHDSTTTGATPEPAPTPAFAYGDGGADVGGEDEPEFRPRPRRRAHALTFALGGSLLIAAGFFGGVLLQKHEDHGSTSAASARNALAGRFAGLTGGATGATGTTLAGGTGGGGAATGGGGGRGFGGFGGGGGAGGAGAVTGTVKLVDGTNVYVTDTGGNVVKIATGPSSQLTKTDPATTKDVAPGDVVIVRGTPNSDGSYTAQTLVISSAAALGG
jgi:hypothetical protein